MKSTLLFATAVVLAACGSTTTRPDAAVRDGGFDPADVGIDDANTGGILAAAPNDRCAPQDRVGVVELSDESGQLFIGATVNDRPAPWIGEPSVADSSCGLYPEASGCACDVDEVCASDGTCVPFPIPAEDILLIVRANGGEQRFSALSPGSAGGEITLAGRSFAVELHALSYVFTAPETEVPGMLSNLSDMLTGTFEAPIALDVRWDPPSGVSHVFTRVPINHHVQSSTFTECAVDAQSGSLHIDRPMLEPLAVATGLEFQGVSHVRFAAARIPNGCIEFRFLTRHYPNL